MLARAQSMWVAGELERLHPGLQVELVLFRTSGDQITERPLHEFGGKGLFTKELEQALLDGAIDFAVHSFKDVPVTMPLVDQADLVVAAVPKREDPRDTLVCAAFSRLADLPAGAKVGTGSLRRKCQALAARPDLQIEPIRGNIDTRLRKLDEGQFDAVILAEAGLRRAGLLDASRMHPIDPDEMIPAPGQGALAVQCRREDAVTREFLRILDDPATALCVSLERELVRLLQGDCHSPIAALAQAQQETLFFRASVGARDGTPPVISARASGPLQTPQVLAERVFENLDQQGVKALLANAK